MQLLEFPDELFSRILDLSLANQNVVEKWKV